MYTVLKEVFKTLGVCVSVCVEAAVATPHYLRRMFGGEGH